MIINHWLEEEKDPKTIRFVITLKDGDKPIGSIDVVNYIDGNPVIGYCLVVKTQVEIGNISLPNFRFLFLQIAPALL